MFLKWFAEGDKVDCSLLLYRIKPLDLQDLTIRPLNSHSFSLFS